MRRAIPQGFAVVPLAGFLLCGSITLAQTSEKEVIGGIQFNFSTPGARSLSLGGAFIGLADDATTAFSNPAGLTKLLEMEISLEGRHTSFVHEFNERGHVFEAPTGLGIDTVSGFQIARSSSQVDGASFLSFVYPFDRWAIAGYRHELANFETEIRTQGVFFLRSDNNMTTRLFPAIGYLDLDVVAHGVSGAFKISDRFSVGLGVAFYDFEMESLTRRFGVPIPNPVFPGTFGPADYSASNLVLLDEQFGKDEDAAINLGFLWAIGRLWNLGGVYRQGPDFGFTTVSSNTTGQSLAFSRRFAVPDVLGFGLAFSPNDSIRVSVDYDRVEYSRLETSTPSIQQPGCESALSVDEADELHVGIEYTSRHPVAVRLGGWYDPDHKVAFRGSVSSFCDQIGSILFPRGDDSFHYTAGLGVFAGRSRRRERALLHGRFRSVDQDRAARRGRRGTAREPCQRRSEPNGG